ncbi:MAG: hypothetical protein OXN89_06355 [Bryobacterales bacterium]|nr:hypothetical protein [Bryobacterales bacterium]
MSRSTNLDTLAACWQRSGTLKRATGLSPAYGVYSFAEGQYSKWGAGTLKDTRPAT